MSADSVTSLALVVVGTVIAVGERAGPTSRRVLGALVVATGVGSVIEHGPGPGWADLAHDLPLVALIAYLGADAAADVVGRRLAAGWWVAPTAALVPLMVAAPRIADGLQAVVAAAATGLALERARVRPETRPTIAATLGLLTVGAVAGTLTRPGWPLGGLPGHPVWHVLAAAALWWLAPVVGRRHATVPPGAATQRAGARSRGHR